MPEVEFTIDPATGKLELHVKGSAGPACEQVATLATDLLDAPGHEQNTPEYYLRPHVQP
ncbi:MAG: DUF2997 domain-containing protein [Hyphomicrobiales bacterium]